MPDLNNDGIITKDEIMQELQLYYSKEVMCKVLARKADVNEVYDKKTIDKKLAELSLGGGGGGSIILDDYYTKDEVKNILNTIEITDVTLEIPVTQDNQRQFDIPATVSDKSAHVLIFNTTVRKDYTITEGNKLNTNFDVPSNGKLTLIVFSVSIAIQ